ncbi:hypothetical protein MAF45_07575 [Mesosutterella sp. OilRF-GAM-744-9]|uniref:Uncharacterized protein n=1 Tax=Mesosutterella porci TaxID=2915351 RepID=A0ABS9MTH1_9BURK|nr:hypothetical protein [Mesosutterella sp. oilRF-744-WT-GAM-9]MCG5031298.1 hypothetical protein [Mesosutterella sp. oilRF-744-WT-GAM-9]
MDKFVKTPAAASPEDGFGRAAGADLAAILANCFEKTRNGRQISAGCIVSKRAQTVPRERTLHMG